MNFFHVLVRFLHCIFYILHFYWNVCSFVPKVNWPRMERSWTSSVRLCFVSLSPNLHGLKSARSCHFCFASLDIKSSRWKIWGVFWCVLWIFLYLSDIGFSDIFDELHQCNTTFLPIIVRPSAFFLVSGDQKHFWWLLKIDYSSFKSFCNITWLLIFHSAYCSSSFLNESTEANYCTCSLRALCVLEMCLWPA